jgi:hypothetical protein
VLERINRLATQSSLAAPAETSPSKKPSDAATSSPNAPPPASISQGSSSPHSSSSLRTQDDRFRRTDDLNEPIIPSEPQSLAHAGLSESIVEEIVARLLLSRGETTGRGIADHIKLPFRLIEPVLGRMKMQQLTVYAGSTAMNDYYHILTDAGRDRARRHLLKTTYFGAAPVPIEHYIQSVQLQSIEAQQPTRDDLKRAFADLLVPDSLLARLGPAINSGRGMFLYGYPGNGKTSIAERVTKSFGQYIWIPRSVLIDGEIMRFFDPLNHEECLVGEGDGMLLNNNIDHRWVRVRRPTIVAGGELTMAMLEITRSPETNISEAPLQLKSNCGVLLIDDFGRQRMGVDELLNRWIVPLEKRHDYLSMSSGKKLQVPFNQLVIFSTNLQPKDLVDDAFLRRIPYKIEVPNPSEEHFRKLFEIMARIVKIPYRPEMVDYLIHKHYKPVARHFRNCHPRDLLMQIRSYCLFNGFPQQMTEETVDFAVENYFSIM